MTSATDTSKVSAPSFWVQVASFGKPFWFANIMEIIERLAYYGVRVVVPIYIASSEDPGGLHFSNKQKGIIFTVWALVQCLLPMFTGGYADRYGRKLTIAVSIGIKICGYLLMATQRSYAGFFLACMVLAAGTAVFKPGVQGTLARGTNKTNSSVGWGIFYQVVNIGGWLGPPLAGYLHRLAWHWVFYSCALIVSLNFITLLMYDDPDEPPEKQAPNASGEKPDAPAASKDSMKEKDAIEVLVFSIKTIFAPRLLAFILIMSGFWVMFMQLYDSLPNFIEEWTNSADVVAKLNLHEGLLAQQTPRGLQVPQEWMINLDSTSIILFMLPIAFLTSRVRTLSSICTGILISCAGLALCGMTMRGSICLFGIFIFAIGEMTASPKMNEYLARIAPKGQEALYMGYANVPFAVGWTSGAFVAGDMYDRMSDKGNLALRYLGDHGQAVGDLKREKAMEALEKFSGTDATGATKLLWDAYQPYHFWYWFIGIGILSAVGMLVFASIAKRWEKEA